MVRLREGVEVVPGPCSVRFQHWASLSPPNSQGHHQGQEQGLGLRGWEPGHRPRPGPVSPPVLGAEDESVLCDQT